MLRVPAPPESPIPNGILTTLHAPALARTPSTPTRICRRLHAPSLPPTKTAKWSSIPKRIRKTLHVPAWAHAENKQREARGFSSQSMLKIRTTPQRKRFNTHNPRTGLAGNVQNSHRATARAFRHARSPQRVRQAGEIENSHGVTARIFPHVRCPQRARRGR